VLQHGIKELYSCCNTYLKGMDMGDALRARVRQSEFSSHSQEALLNLVVVVDYLRQKFVTACSAHGLTTAQYNVLRILKGAHPEGHARCEISKRMLDRSPDVTRLIDTLQQKGLAERVGSDEDARLSVARITKKGLKLLETMFPMIDALDRQLENKLTPEEIRRLSELCEKVYAE